MKNNRTHHPHTNDAEADTRAQNERLTPEEEKELSIRIQKGKQAKAKLQNGTALTAEEKAAEQRIVDDGIDARNTLFERNQGLVYKFANEQFKYNCGVVRDYNDFLQDGMMYLYIAAGSYDWAAGCLFCTYASRCIQNGFYRNNALLGGSIRVAEGLLPKVGQYKKLRQEHSANEIAILMDMPRETVIQFERFLPGSSLQDPVGQDEEMCELGELIADPNATTTEDIDDAIDAHDRWLQAEAALAQLPAEQARVLRLLFGFETGEKLTLAQTADILGCSVNGVHKKEKSAINKLRKLLDSDLNDLPLAA